MRKSFVMFSLLAGILVLALWSLPVMAASVLVSDADLADISGKATNGSVQYGSYTWTDQHTNDTSNHKGANDMSGSNSAVQQTVTASADNVINWGAYSAMHFVAGNLSGTASQTIETRATQDIGGF